MFTWMFEQPRPIQLDKFADRSANNFANLIEVWSRTGFSFTKIPPSVYRSSSTTLDVNFQNLVTARNTHNTRSRSIVYYLTYEVKINGNPQPIESAITD